jgi:diguanylate cyclase (GGDEF)-like protein
LLAKVLVTGATAEAEIAGLPGYLGTDAPWRAVCFPAGNLEIGFMALEATDRRIDDALRSIHRQLESMFVDLQQSGLVHDMAHLFQAATVTEELYRIVESFAPRLFPGSSGALFVIDSSGEVVERTAVWGESADFAPFISPDDCLALRGGLPHVISHPELGLVCAHSARDRQYAQICVPMLAKADVLGFVHLQNRHTDPSGEAFTHTQLLLIHDVAEEIALSLANVRVQETLRHQAFRDSLTGLYNRRFMQEALALELHRAERTRLPVGLVMLDVDGFKRINDTYGHAAGDSVLQAISTLLQSKVRASDLLCRYGGDEFVVVMPETSLEDATRRANEWRAAIKLQSIEWERKIIEGLAISFGVSAYPICSTSALLFREADSALYSAKASTSPQLG